MINPLSKLGLMNKKIMGVLLIAIAFVAFQARTVSAQVGVPISTLTDLYSTMENKKNFGLNQMAFLAAKQVLHQMAASTIDWINSGFQGKPVFLSDPEAFLLDVADQATGAFLSENGASAQICSPWAADIRLVISLDHALTDVNGFQSRRYTCTLGTIINNAKNATINGYSIRGFVNGDFEQGGWPAFIAFTTESNNNPAGAYLQARSDLWGVIGAKKNAITLDLLQGRGFLSKKNCVTINGVNGPEEKCEVVTPGSAIAESLENATGVPFRELELAQDINAVLSALISQMINQMLQKGLATLSTGGSGTTGGFGNTASAYTSQVLQDATSAKTVGFGSGAGSIQTQTLLEIESTYQAAVSAVTESKVRYETAKACFATIQDVAYGTSQMAAIDAVLNTQVNPLLSTLNTKLAAASARVASANTGTSVTTVPATNNLNDFETIISDQISNYESGINAGLQAGTDLNADASAAENVLSDASQKANMFSADATRFQNDCDSRP